MNTIELLNTLKKVFILNEYGILKKTTHEKLIRVYGVNHNTPFPGHGQKWRVYDARASTVYIAGYKCTDVKQFRRNLATTMTITYRHSYRKNWANAAKSLFVGHTQR